VVIEQGDMGGMALRFVVMYRSGWSLEKRLNESEPTTPLSLPPLRGIASPMIPPIHKLRKNVKFIAVMAQRK
jgi:hypothetical protein